MMSRPKIRRATFGDMMALKGMVHEMHERSRWSDEKVNDKHVQSLLMQSIQRHGLQKAGGTFVAVADTGKSLEGFIIGALQPLYLIGERCEATDLFWYTRPGANAATANRLMRAMHRWAEGAGAVLRNAVSDAVTDPAKSGRLLRALGMREIGAVYEKDSRPAANEEAA